MQRTFHTLFSCSVVLWRFPCSLTSPNINLISLLLEYTDSWLRKDGRQQRTESLCFWQIRWSWRCVSCIFILETFFFVMLWIRPGGVFGGLVIKRSASCRNWSCNLVWSVRRLSTLVIFPLVIHYSNFLMKSVTFFRKIYIFFYFYGICAHSWAIIL